MPPSKSRTSKPSKSKVTGVKLEAPGTSTTTPPPFVDGGEQLKRMKQFSDAGLLWAKQAQANKANNYVDPFKVRSNIHPFTPPPEALANDEKLLAMDDGLPGVAWASGYGPNNVLASGYAFLGYPFLSELTQIPEYRRVSEIIATEMTRKWIKLQASGDEDKTAKVKELTDYMKHMRVREAFRDMAMYDGFMGRSHLYIDTGDTDNYDELKVPIGNGWDEISKIKIQKGTIKEFKPVEAVWCYPLQYNSSNPLKKDWYKPRHWYAMANNVHCSRLLTFVGREVPDLLKPAYSFGGLSLSQMVAPTVNYWLRTRQSVNDLIHYFSVFGIQTQLMTMLQPGNEEMMWKRAELFNAARDNRNLLLLDKDTEEAFIQAAPLGTLDVLQAQSLEHICCTSGIPLVKYTGVSPHGLNASSEGEIRVFFDWIEAYQHHLFDLNLHSVLGMCMLSLWGEVDNDISYDYEPLWTLDAAQEAGVRKTEAETDEILIGLGVISPEESRKRVAKDPDTPFDGLDVNDLPQQPGVGEPGGPDDIDIQNALRGRPLIPPQALGQEKGEEMQGEKEDTPPAPAQSKAPQSLSAAKPRQPVQS